MNHIGAESPMTGWTSWK